LSSGLFTALITSAAGLGVAIVGYAGYNLLVSRVDSILLDMERVFGEVMIIIPKPSSNSPV